MLLPLEKEKNLHCAPSLIRIIIEMSIELPEKCLRGYDVDACYPLSQIESDEKPVTFICCGMSNSSTRSVDTDKYRVCFKSVYTDTCYDYDIIDIVDTISVLSRALSCDRENIPLNA